MQLAGRLESMSDVEELTSLVRPRPGQGMGAGQVKTELHSPIPVACLSPTAARCQ